MTLYGRPCWIAEAAPVEADWGAVTPDFGEMPRLRAAAGPTIRARRGRLSLSQSHPAGATWAAYMKDFLGYTYGRIARDKRILLAVDGGDAWRSRGAQRYVAVGRELLHARGLAPWAVWGKGKVPGYWWKTDEFLDSLHLWARKSAREQAGALVLQAREETLETVLRSVGAALDAPQRRHRALWQG